MRLPTLACLMICVIVLLNQGLFFPESRAQDIDNKFTITEATVGSNRVTIAWEPVTKSEITLSFSLICQHHSTVFSRTVENKGFHNLSMDELMRLAHIEQLSTPCWLSINACQGKKCQIRGLNMVESVKTNLAAIPIYPSNRI